MSIDRVLATLHSREPVVGLTHGFYRYPACMSPDFAFEVIDSFSQPGDYVLDPFMGGGTSVVASVAAGRRAIGIDLNSLAHFVATVKTTPLSAKDVDTIRCWAIELGPLIVPIVDGEWDARTRNLPGSMQQLFARLLEEVEVLPLPRQQRFVRCMLLRLGQWAIDGKVTLPDSFELRERLLVILDEMVDGLAEYVEAAQAFGIPKNKLTGQRALLCRSAAGVHEDPHLADVVGKVRLVLTSPPYPGVHVLYHRWQVAGRRETPAPYWVIGSQDGNGASYYTLGSRTKVGLSNYFRGIGDAFRSVRALIHPEALVVQLVAFSDVETQLPVFLEAMEQAGYCEDNSLAEGCTDLWRDVPNRRWYNYLGTARSLGQELLLFHRPHGGV